MRPGVRSAPFRILYVCVANACRSVLAERLTRRGLILRLGESAGRFHASSAGTEAAPGQPMHPYVRELLDTRQAPTGGFERRRLTPALLTAADLVLTAGGSERDLAISLLPGVLSRTFTIREFARLIDHLAPSDLDGGEPAERARQVVASAQRMRGRLPYVDPASYDIPDPPADRVAFGQCAASVAVAVEAVLDALCPARTRLPPLAAAAGPVPAGASGPAPATASRSVRAVAYRPV